MRQATKADVPAIMDIVAETVAQMHNQGNTQWDETYPTAADFLQDVLEGTLYVIDDAGEILGFACMNQSEPAGYQAVPWRMPGPALVVHRMAVAQAARGKGLAKEMMAYAETLAREKATPYIKVDTYSKNPAMNQLLLSLGYKLVGHMEFKSKREQFNCYDKKL